MSTSTSPVTAPTTSTRPSPAGVRRNPRHRVNRLHFILAPLALLWMIPVIMILGLSLLPTSDPSTTFFNLLLSSPSLSNYANVWQQNPIFRNLVNSLMITVPSVVLVTLAGSVAAFALAMLKVSFRGVIFAALILARVLSMSGIVVAIFKILQSFGLYNSLSGLTLVYTALGLLSAVIIFRTAFLALPYETYEASVLDGANKWQTYRQSISRWAARHWPSSWCGG
jgi:raffinose/stachyose/melibiose transport system permease protein